MNNCRIFLAGLAALPCLSGSVFADGKDISPKEPVILQCQQDGICTCGELGGDAYIDGLKIRCVFKNRPVKSTYAYFKKFHTPELSRFITEKFPLRSKHWSSRDIKTSDNVDIDYTTKRDGYLKIQIDFMNGGYGYTFTPEAENTVLEFLYFSYN